MPREDLDVVMIAPKAPGHTGRSTYAQGGGTPMLIAVHRDQSGKARDLALSYAAAIGGAPGGGVENTLKEKEGNDPFREQTGLFGGGVGIVQKGGGGVPPSGAPARKDGLPCRTQP